MIVHTVVLSGNQIVIMDGFSIMVSVVRGAGYFYKQGDRNDITMSKTEDILEWEDNRGQSRIKITTLQ